MTLTTTHGGIFRYSSFFEITKVGTVGQFSVEREKVHTCNRDIVSSLKPNLGIKLNYVTLFNTENSLH